MMSREILEKLTQKQLIDAYLGLKYKYETLEAKHHLVSKDYAKLAVEDSWRRNPDRMGGQFTQEEIETYERGVYGGR